MNLQEMENERIRRMDRAIAKILDEEEEEGDS